MWSRRAPQRLGFRRLGLQKLGQPGLRQALVALCAAGASLTLASVSQAGLEEGRNKAQACVACHGADGNAVSPDIPSLAAQPKQFLVQSLYMYREGVRKNAIMSPLAMSLSNADLNDLATFFSAQTLAAPARAMDPARVAQSRTVAERNNCVACHTPSFKGQQHIPRLAGQGKAYLLAQLVQFKASTRADLDGTMTSAAQGLAAEELEPLAEYLATFVAP
jgi:cytochrome c553